MVSNADDGRIRGCVIVPMGDSDTSWNVTIDGVEADLGKFSDAIYRKICSDAKQQQFQGFRPGTIPPHLLPTYRTFAMDECAREATLEALQQNNVRPFEDGRNDFLFTKITIPPPVKKGRKKKKKGGRKKKKVEAEAEIVEEPKWLTFEGSECMKGAIDAGWQPGESFSFLATNVKGQKLNDQSVDGAAVLGAKPSPIEYGNLNLDAIRKDAD